MDVSIVSPEQEVWRGEAELVIARSPEGEFGIMRGHIPFLAALVPGKLTIDRMLLRFPRVAFPGDRGPGLA